MPKWKTQTAEPDTCSIGHCVIYEKFDTLAEPRVVVVVGYKQRCTGHDDGLAFPTGLIQAWDGNWRSESTHLNWERAFYLFQIGKGADPSTPAALTAPTAEAIAGLARAYAWHRHDNGLKGRVLDGLPLEVPSVDIAEVDWWFEGVGDLRQLHVDTNNQLKQPERANVEAAIELAFGPDRIVWEG